MLSVARHRYEDIAERLTDAAELAAHVDVYITAEDVAAALGDKAYGDASESPYAALTTWIDGRRMLGFEPSVDDILAWIARVEIAP